MLPDINGSEVCRRIKTNPKLQGTFVILVSPESRFRLSIRQRDLMSGQTAISLSQSPTRHCSPGFRPWSAPREQKTLSGKRKTTGEAYHEAPERSRRDQNLEGIYTICASRKKYGMMRVTGTSWKPISVDIRMPYSAMASALTVQGRSGLKKLLKQI
jgi:hypothetical protein